MTESPAQGLAHHLAGIGRYRLLLGIAATVLILDQTAKIWIQFYSGLPHGVYPPWAGITIIPGFFNLVFSTNTGAAWGMFAGYGRVLTLLAVAALAAIFWFRHSLQLPERRMQVAFGLLCGGIAGNLVDRAAHGYVVDFLDVIIFNYRWPTFNIADCGITIGVTLYIILSFTRSNAEEDRG